MRSRLVIIAAIAIVLQACGGKKDSPAPDQPSGTVGNPGKTAIAWPENNSICVTGNPVSDTQSTVGFSWNKAENTDSYDVVVKNLLTAVVTTKNATGTNAEMVLNTNTPYSWYVVSKSAKTSATAQSVTWKFYNAGAGITVYVPFPAELQTPASGQVITASSVSLTWKGSAPDGTTIANYDVCFGTTANPPLVKSATSDSFLNGINLAPKTIYYWKVITRDLNGNTSESGVSQFSTN